MIKTACTAGYTVLLHVARLFTFVVYASAVYVSVATVYTYACSLLHNVHGLLTLGTHAQRGLQYLVCKSVCLSVRLSVTTFSATTRNKAAKKQYQRVQCHTGLI